MEQLNNELLSYYGLILIGYEGILDMPSRMGDTFYDWGDQMQPLIGEQDIFWQAREFTMKVLFDARITERTLEDVLGELANLTECPLNSKYGDFTVKIRQVVNIQEYGDIAQLSILFRERLPEFGIPSIDRSGGEGVLIDGYGLMTDFGIIVKKVDHLDVPMARTLNNTVFNTAQTLSDYRGFKTIELDCAKVYNNTDELTQPIGEFKNLLSQSGYRTLTYQEETYDCFLTEGFRVDILKNLVNFKIKLNHESI